MLAGAGPLLQRDRVFTLDYKAVKIFSEQHGDRFRHRPDHAGLDGVEFVENGQSPVLKDRIRIQYEEPGFHKWRVSGKN